MARAGRDPVEEAARNAREVGQRRSPGPPAPSWQEALASFVVQVRRAYGERLERVVLYGSCAQGKAVNDSDVEILVILDRCEDFWAEFDRVKTIAMRVSDTHDVVISALPCGLRAVRA